MPHPIGLSHTAYAASSAVNHVALSHYVDIDYANLPIKAEELAQINERQINNIGFGLGRILHAVLRMIAPSLVKEEPINVNSTDITKEQIRQLVGNHIYYVPQAELRKLANDPALSEIQMISNYRKKMQPLPRA